MKFNEYRKLIIEFVNTTILSWVYKIRSFNLMDEDTINILENVRSLQFDLQELNYWKRTEESIKVIDLTYERFSKITTNNVVLSDQKLICEFIKSSKVIINKRINKGIKKLIDIKFNPYILRKIYDNDKKLLSEIKLFQSRYNYLSKDTRNNLKIYLETRIKEVTNDVKQIYEVR